MSDNPLSGREREAADRERAAGYFDAPRGIADLPEPPVSRRWLAKLVLLALAAALVYGLVRVWRP